MVNGKITQVKTTIYLPCRRVPESILLCLILKDFTVNVKYAFPCVLSPACVDEQTTNTISELAVSTIEKNSSFCHGI